MGVLIRFPVGRSTARKVRHVDANKKPAEVIILPAVRIERHADKATDAAAHRNPRRSRRRRVAQ